MSTGLPEPVLIVGAGLIGTSIGLALRARDVDVRLSDHDPANLAAAVLHNSLGRYDAVLSLYHDQGHIAAKMLDFEKTVSVTLGLPILRTSVDHGVAYDAAKKGTAEIDGMRAALAMAVALTEPSGGAA